MRRIFTLLATAVLTCSAALASVNANYNINCYDCTIDWYEALWVDYSSTEAQKPVFNGWNIILKGNQGEKVIVCILDMDNLGTLVDGRDYTEADIITDWSGVTLPGTYEDLNQETGITYTQTHDEDGKLHVVVDMTGKSGRTYHVVYDEKCQAIGGYQELTFTDDQVTLMDNTNAPGIRNFQIIAEIPGQLSMMVCVTSDHIAGTYGFEDVIQDFSDITWGDTQNGEYSVLKFCDVQMNVTEDPIKEGAYYYDINVVTKLGYGYHTLLHTKPWERPDIQITDTATIHANNLRMMDYRDVWGELLFIASSPEYSLNLYAYSSEPQGTFTNKEIDFAYNYVWYFDKNGVERQANGIDGEYTYTETADGNRSLTGWLDCDNGVHYILDLRYNHAEPTRVVEVTTADAILDDQRGPDGGGIIIEGYGENQYILMGIYTPEIEGVYTEQDMDWQTTYIVEFDNAETEEYMLELLDANVTVTDNHDGETYSVEARITMQAEMNKNDVVEYIIHMTASNFGGAAIRDLVAGGNAPSAKVRKVMRNGRIIVIANGDKYDMVGTKLK